MRDEDRKQGGKERQYNGDQGQEERQWQSDREPFSVHAPHHQAYT